uniref:Uncharacterized protein n=1 Tax=Athene cunicularia TaxID=194338 RepID=A0A663MEQ5_ATHCN
MTEINLRLYISIFPRNCTKALVTVENFMQTTALSSVPEAKDLWQNSALFLMTVTEMVGRRIKGKEG